MGEKQKSIGEEGENIVNKILDIAGWRGCTKNRDIKCINGSNHLNEAGKPRKSHGIDIIYHSESLLISRHLEIALISVKYTTQKYPANPQAKLKEYFADLISAINCFNYSELKSEIQQGYSTVDFDSTIGVLFWLSNNAEGYDDLTERVRRIDVIKGEEYDTLVLVDNRRAQFILDANTYVNREFSGQNIKYYYFRTGLNLDMSGSESSGDVLPIYWLSSDIIPYKILDETSKDSILLIIYDGEINEDNMLRLIGLSKDICSSWAKRTYIASRNYNKITHADLVTSIKLKFKDKDFIDTVKFDSIDKSIHNVESE